MADVNVELEGYNLGDFGTDETVEIVIRCNGDLVVYVTKTESGNSVENIDVPKDTWTGGDYSLIDKECGTHSITKDGSDASADLACIGLPDAYIEQYPAG
jgi:hypothetical protein